MVTVWSTEVDRWRVLHPGIGVLSYNCEAEARTAAGTAGEVFSPGEVPLQPGEMAASAASSRAGRPLPAGEIEARRERARLEAEQARVGRAREIALDAAARIGAAAVGSPKFHAPDWFSVSEVAAGFELYLLEGIEAARAYKASRSTQDGAP